MQELRNVEMPKTPFSKESEFTTHWLRALKEKGYWAKKWSDASMDLKPYDCDIRTNIDSYHCEIKLIDKDGFKLSMIRPNQHKALAHISSLGGKAIVVIYSAELNRYEVYGYTQLVELFAD